MNKMKVMTVVGTRPEIIRLSRTMTLLDQYCEQVIVHTGQNYDYELNQIFFDDLELRKPDHFLGAAGKSAAETIGRVIIAVDEVLDLARPDALLVLGDTNSCLAVIPAKRRRIPTFHMEAGNRCFDLRVPEEINRRIVDHTADVNLTYSSIARQYLLAEGLSPDLVIKTGSPMFEVLLHYKNRIEDSKVLEALSLKRDEFILVSAHREENIEPDASFGRLVDLLNGVASAYQLPVIVSTHPRTRKRIEGSAAQFNSLVRFMKPMRFSDYNKLQCEALVTLSDSGTISEESSILNFRALNIREAHERPEAMEEAAVIMTGLNLERVIQAIEVVRCQSRGDRRFIPVVADYAVPNVAEKVVRLIHSYADYVQRVVWKAY
jgi:UDP-N-acetylglucosamine 2-epimerase